MKLIIICFVAILPLVYADQTVWSYDLTVLPDGWSSTGSWKFGDRGAIINIESGLANYGNHSIYTEVIHIPYGTDSLTLFAPQFFQGSSNQGAVYARLIVNLNDDLPLMLWGHSWINTSGTDTQPIIEGLCVTPGDSLSFYFGCDANPFGVTGWASLSWYISELELVLHEDIQVFDGVSWGLLKTLYY